MTSSRTSWWSRSSTSRTAGAPGEPGAKLLVTNLVNRIQPLIRYELSNEVAIAPGPDPSGRPYGRIARVDGRSDDVLRFPALAGGEVAVHPYRLRRRSRRSRRCGSTRSCTVDPTSTSTLCFARVRARMPWIGFGAHCSERSKRWVLPPGST